MRIFALMPVRNEASRYLDAVLKWHNGFFDQIFVFDDQSEDESVNIIETNGAVLGIRESNDRSFLEHEGAFRQAAWDAMEKTLKPQDGDWIFALDADEFLVSLDGRQLREIAISAQSSGFDSVQIPIPEVFALKDGCPFVRVDGYWANLSAPRFFTYVRGATFKDVAMACGSAPQQITRPNGSSGLRLLHYGYVRQEDKAVKYKRYSGRPGHNSVHVNSIVQQPRLERWNYKYPILDI